MEVNRSAAAHNRRGRPVSFSFGHYRDFTRKDGFPFSTVPASNPSGDVSKPEGVLGYCHLEVGKKGDVILVRLGKHRVLDEQTVNKISDELLGVADRPDCHRLLLDLSGVTQLSSAMLAKLVQLHKKMVSKGEKLRLCGLNPQLRSVFATTRLDWLFDITDTEASALEADAPQSPPFAQKAI
jgi:anti-sigma B factor antagonist